MTWGVASVLVFLGNLGVCECIDGWVAGAVCLLDDGLTGCVS